MKTQNSLTPSQYGRDTSHKPKVSVVIPVYRAAPYIGKCARTLFEQTLEEMEFIFIDDQSPDDSIEIVKDVLKNYPARKNQVKILLNEKNLGVGATRQRGIDVAKGDYLIHCDPDDWTEPSLYEELYKEAVRNKSEIVVCDFYKEFKDTSILTQQNVQADKKELLNDIISGKFHTALWNKLVHRDFWNEKGMRIDSRLSLWEDMSVMTPLMLSTSKVSHVGLPLYHYKMGVNGSITNGLNETKILSKIQAVKNIGDYLQAHGLMNKYKEQYEYFKLKTSKILLTQYEYLNPVLWRQVTQNIKISGFKTSKSIKLLVYLAIYKIDFLVYLLAWMNYIKIKLISKFRR